MDLNVAALTARGNPFLLLDSFPLRQRQDTAVDDSPPDCFQVLVDRSWDLIPGFVIRSEVYTTGVQIFPDNTTLPGPRNQLLNGVYNCHAVFLPNAC